MEKQRSRPNGTGPNGAGKNGSQSNARRNDQRPAQVTLTDVSAELDDAANSLSRASGMLKQIAETALGKGDNGAGPRESKQAAPALAQRLSVRQLSAIHSAARRVGLNQEKLDALLEKVAGQPVEVARLTRQQASEVLDHLNGKSGYSS